MLPLISIEAFEQLKAANPLNYESILFRIVHTIRLIDTKNDELYMSRFVCDLLGTKKCYDTVRKLLPKIANHLNDYITSKSIINLFIVYMSYLSEKIQAKPSFSWAMSNARIASHPRVEEFLKSELSRMTYGNVFQNKQEGRSFANTYGGLKHVKSYSVDMQTQGQGTSTCVEIVKNFGHFDHLMSNYNRIVTEYNCLKELVAKFQI